MRYILLFWGLPMGLFWGWFYLSYNDINFGMLFFSRQMHDFAFAFYGNLIGIDPQTIPPLVARACVVDTALIFGIFAFRKRRGIVAGWQRMRASMAASPAREAGQVPPAE